MEISAPLLALVKLLALFAFLVLLLRLRVKLWIAVLAAAAALALASGIMPQQWPALAAAVLSHRDFIILCVMIWLIILLSSVQDVTGQSRNLVAGLENYIRSPRLRLVIFPALVGLLPMPGGALFSCPMIRDAAHDMAVSDEKKSLINYWFRHIWECAWPLYPGYALACSLLNIPMSVLWRYTFPLVAFSFCAGWFAYMRDLARSPLLAAHGSGDACAPPDAPAETLGRVLLHALPIAVTLAGAALFGFVLDRAAPSLPGQLAFCASLALAVLTAVLQGRGAFSRPLASLLFNANVRRILLLLAAIYLFKDSIAQSGLIKELSAFGSGSLMVVAACVAVPFISGLLTGILVGLVGIAFPIIIGLVAHSPLHEYMLPLAVLSLLAGNCGQLLSPLHVCLVVTCEFFTSSLPGVWKKLLPPTACIFVVGAIWVAILALAGAHF